MKKFWTLILTLVLTAALFTGCGCTNTERDDASTPTGMTQPMQTTQATQPSTAPATQATRPSMEETTPTGNGAMEDAPTGSTEGTDGAVEGRARSGQSGGMPGAGGGMTGGGGMSGAGGMGGSGR